MKTVTIHQPYFLPWTGYFSKLAYSDTFIILDDVYFRDRFYHKRALIENMNGIEQFITLPVGHNYETPLKDVKLIFEKQKTLNKIIKTIRYSYSKTTYFKQEWTDFEEILRLIVNNSNILVDINKQLIEYFIKILNLKNNKIVFSSELLKGFEISNPTDRYLILCKKLEVDAIITGNGKSLVIHDFDIIEKRNIDVYIQDFFTNFSKIENYYNINPKLSIIDALFRIGRKNLKELLHEDVFKPQKRIK